MEKKWKFDSNLDKTKHGLREREDFSLIWLGIYGEKGRREEEERRRKRRRRRNTGLDVSNLCLEVWKLVLVSLEHLFCMELMFGSLEFMFETLV